MKSGFVQIRIFCFMPYVIRPLAEFLKVLRKIMEAFVASPCLDKLNMTFLHVIQNSFQHLKQDYS